MIVIECHVNSVVLKETGLIVDSKCPFGHFMKLPANWKGAYTVRTVSYTHLDVYKRQS